MMQNNSHEETMLVSTGLKVGGLPVLECSNCHFQANHFFYYEDATYARMAVKQCPKCGFRILGAVIHG